LKSSNLRIVFFGTSEFAVASLEVLLKNNFDIAGVVTVPDKPSGRGQKLQISPVKKFALENNLLLLQPEKLKDPAFLEDLRQLKADLQIVIAFRILPEEVWKMAPLGTFNLHASLLPRYRGAAPINWAIINGEKETGVTTFFLDENIDTGKIIFSEKVIISEEETAGELHDKLKILGAGLVEKTIKAIEEHKIPQTEQSVLEKELSSIKTAPKIKKEDCRIKWNNSAEDIFNFIRGLSPIPAAFTELVSPDGIKYYCRIFSTAKELKTTESSTGSIITDSKTFLGIAVTGGTIFIKEIQLMGKRKLSIEEFLRGFRIDNTWKVN
jgi:methionyl-tRNA formyltransferase